MIAQNACERWVFRPRPRRDALVRLFCFPYAGAGASVFNGWPAELPGYVDACMIQPPGRENRLSEAPIRRVAMLASEIATALGPFLDVPFAFFGHSFGALVAFETARRLRQNGSPFPLHLFASGFRAPHVAPRARPIHNLPASELLDELRAFKGTPTAVFEDRELTDLLLPAIRADFEAFERYCYMPERPLECPITAMGGNRDELVSRQELAGWRSHTDSAFSTRWFEGDHFYLHPNRASLIGAVRDELAYCLLSCN
jgi:surfactin synthase thioesterase subunit